MSVSGFVFFLKLVVGLGTTANAYLAVAAGITRLALLAAASKALTEKPSLQQLSQEKLQTVRSNVEPRRAVYGEDLISGPLAFLNTAGAENRHLYQSIALTAHECAAIPEVWTDVSDPGNDHPNTVVADADIDNITFNVTAGRYAEVDASTPVMRIFRGLGEDPAPAIDPILSAVFPSIWTAGHDFNGTSHLTVGMFLVTDKEDVYQTTPQSFRALVRGKLLYDPRKDSTNGGAGSHRLNDASTWEWSDNPALCVADYLRARSTDYPLVGHIGFTALDAEVDWPKVITAADICDQLVAIPTASTQKRYTCNGTIDSSMQPRDVIDSMVESMMGRIVYVNGVWQMWAGAALASTITLSERNLRDGAVDLQPQAKHIERWNRVRGKYVNPAEFYQPTGYEEQRSSTFQTDDGGDPNYKELDFNFTNNEFECQRNAIIKLKKSRNQRILVMPCNWSALRIQPGVTVDINLDVYGFAGEKFMVTEWMLGADGAGVDLTMVQETDADWTDPLEGDYVPRAATSIGFNDTGVPPPDDLVATPVFEGNLLSWTNAPSTTYDHTEIYAADENVRSSAVVIATTKDVTYTEVLHESPRQRWYWTVNVDIFNRRSAFEPDLTTTLATATPLSAATNILVDPDFDKSTLATLGQYWGQNVKDGIGNLQSAAVDLLIGGGENSSNAIRLRPSITPAPTGITQIISARRHRLNIGAFEARIRYKCDTADITDFQFVVAGFESETGGTRSGIGGDLVTLPDTSGAFQTAIVRVDVTNTVKQFFEFEFGMRSDNGVDLTIDSIFIHAASVIFGDEVIGTDLQPGQVPLALASDATKVLQGDATWVNQTGGATSLDGLSDVTITAAATGDVIFKSAGDWINGDLAAAGIAAASHTHMLADILDSGALAALDTVGTAEIDNNAVTLAKLQDIATDSFIGRGTAGTGDPEVLSAADARAILNVVDSFEGRSGTVVATVGDYADIAESYTAFQIFKAGLRIDEDAQNSVLEFDVDSASFQSDISYFVGGVLSALVRYDPNVPSIAWQDRDPTAVTRMSLDMNAGTLSLPLDAKVFIGSSGRTGIAHLNLFANVDPGSPAEGDLWHSGTDDTLKLRSSGVTIDLGAGADVSAGETVTGDWTFQSDPVIFNPSASDHAIALRGFGANEQSFISFESDIGTEFARIGALNSAHDLILRSVIDDIVLDAGGVLGAGISALISSTGSFSISGGGEFNVFDGGEVRAFESGDVNYVRAFHDATRGNISTAGGAGGNLRLASQGGAVEIGSGAGLRVNDIGNAEYLQWANTGSDVALTGVTTSLLRHSGVDLQLSDNDELQFGSLTGGDASMAWDGTDLILSLVSGALIMQDELLTGARLDDFAVESQNVTGIASTTINYLNGQDVNLALGAANITTLTLSNWPATGNLGQLELLVTQGATPRTIAWPAAVNWPGGAAPDLNTANGRFLIHLRSNDALGEVDGTFTDALS